MRAFNVLFVITSSLVFDIHLTEQYKLDSGLVNTFLQLQTVINDPLQVFISKLKNTAVSTNCTSAVTKLLTAVVRREVWALKMLDASAKLGTGITDGNLIWPGSFSTCTSINREFTETNIGFQTHYCWSEYSVKSWMHVIPFKIGLCLPDVCTEEDISKLFSPLAHHMSHYVLDSVVKVNDSVKFKDATCFAANLDISSDNGAIISLLFLTVVIILVTTATFYDWYIENKIDDGSVPIGRCFDVIMCFSLYKNAAILFNTKQSRNTLTCINGIRVLSMMWIILAHVYRAAAFQNDNMIDLSKWVNGFSVLFIGQANFAVDTFLVISGLLVTNVYLREYEKPKGNIPLIPWLKFFAHRYWRLTPVYIVVLFIFEDSLSKYYSNGPFWPENGFFGDNCKKTWWWNLLYINNFLPLKRMCMGHTFYLALDTQFYLICPIILIFLRKSEYVVVASSLIGTSILSSLIWTRFNFNRLNDAFKWFESENKDLFADLYSKPYFRISPFLIGMIFGYLLYRFKCKVSMNKMVVFCGWIIAIGISSCAIFGLYRLKDDYVAMYFTFSRSLWAIAISWVIFSCCTGYGGFVNRILSSPFWQPLSNSTYCCYLIHQIIVKLYFLSLSGPIHFSHLHLFFIYLGILITSFACSICLALTIEYPLLAIGKLFLL